VKKIIFLVVGLLVLGASSWVIYQRIHQSQVDAAKAEIPPTEKAQRRDIEAAIETTGIAQPVISTEIRSEISGRIDAIRVKNGDVAKKGDVLMELDKISLNADLDAAQRELQAQELRLEKAKRDYQRQVDLHAKGFAVESEFADAHTAMDLAGIDLQVRQSQLANVQDKLSKATIVAPQDGIVSDITVNPGQVIIGATSVNQGTLLMKINNLDAMVVEADINEIDIPQVKLNQKTVVTFDSMPNLTFNGTISEVAPSATNRNNLRVFPVRVAFELQGQNVRPGISANIRVPTDKVEKVLSIVISAVYSNSGHDRYVYARTGENTFEHRSVEVGLADTAHVEIKSGLKEGEEVALSRPKSVANGDIAEDTKAKAGNQTVK